MRWLAEGRGNPQSIYQSLCDLAIGLGCIGLILGAEDEEARGHFVRAVEYAGKLLTAPGSTKGPPVYDVQLEASASDVRPLAIHEIPPSREPSKLSVIDYAQILYVTVAFGDQDSMARVAAVPEDAYQNANVIAPPAPFGSFRAWKAWLSCSEAEARKEALAALKACTEEAGRAACRWAATTRREAGRREGAHILGERAARRRQRRQARHAAAAVQIVKRWVDARGAVHERVADVAGGDNGASVDLATCEPRGAGHKQLCAAWSDPAFDPKQRAFSYARVLENPTCRWSQHVCAAKRVDCAKPETIGDGLAGCCAPEHRPVIQERAWTSPIWVQPE